MNKNTLKEIVKEIGGKVTFDDKNKEVKISKNDKTIKLGFKNGYLLIPTKSGRRFPTASKLVVIKHLKELLKEELKINSLNEIPDLLDKLGFKWHLSEATQTYFIYINEDFEDTLRVDIRKNMSFVEIVLKAEIKNPENLELLPKAQKLYLELREVFSKFL